MHEHNHEVFSVKKAKYLTRWFRNILQNPHRILNPYIKNGMVVLDFGCGPGFFTIEAAKLVGEKGKVLAVDLQQGMLDLLAEKVKGSDIEKRIILYKCETDKIGINEKVDVVIAFHVVHEVPDKIIFLNETKNILNSGGILYLSEPKHRVNQNEFDDTIKIAKKQGFVIVNKPKVFLDRTVILKNNS